MMMSSRGLPIELLDEEELRQHFKRIDDAIERVRKDIARAGIDQKDKKPRVKLAGNAQLSAR
jgi:hypothetical protein